MQNHARGCLLEFIGVFFVLDYTFKSFWETLSSFQAHGLYFQNQFLSHNWLLCHWSHQGHAPPSIVVCQQLPAEKWSFLSWRGIWTEIAWHNHLFGSCEYSQTATQSLLCSRACTMARSYWTLIPQRCSEAQLWYTGTVLYIKRHMIFFSLFYVWKRSKEFTCFQEAFHMENILM